MHFEKKRGWKKNSSKCAIPTMNNISMYLQNNQCVSKCYEMVKITSRTSSFILHITLPTTKTTSTIVAAIIYSIFYIKPYIHVKHGYMHIHEHFTTPNTHHSLHILTTTTTTCAMCHVDDYVNANLTWREGLNMHHGLHHVFFYLPYVLSRSIGF